LVLEYAARHAQKYGGIVGLSGALLGTSTEPSHYQGALGGTPVLLAWGERDTSLSLDRLEHTARVLRQLGGNGTATLPGYGQRVNYEKPLDQRHNGNLAR
jgi:phospholipase/carboxylesterase